MEKVDKLIKNIEKAKQEIKTEKEALEAAKKNWVDTAGKLEQSHFPEVVMYVYMYHICIFYLKKRQSVGYLITCYAFF